MGNRYLWKEYRNIRGKVCEVCGKPKGCSFALDTDLICCRRVKSDTPTRSGNGWLHNRSSSERPLVIYKPKLETSFDAANVWSGLLASSNDARVDELATLLGVSVDSLQAIGCVWTTRHYGGAWAFPMRDASGEVTGIRLRKLDGKKLAIKDSKQGLFIPEKSVRETLYVCEGESDTAAALSIGLYAIGRPSCLGCEQIVSDFCRASKIKRAVIVSDNDAPKANGDRPGLRGAIRLREALRLPSVLFIPPVKDLREFINRGGDVSDIESVVRESVWRIGQGEARAKYSTPHAIAVSA